ncbi:hypothetical protein [Shewanella glacialimarina]|uniref:hypothetical protein n=1 Tax=Shewanella glacialimarina TaxID=2590884 RepID=UPI001CF87DF4|nr:hypothetical protein [Shewanella glacialimarina]UCX05753.1 hypothetical protein FJ709_15425 [Shewanella glacialimarina]
MKSFLKESVLLGGLINRVTDWYVGKFSGVNACQRIVVSEVDYGFFPLEVLAQIDYATMQNMINVSDGRQC